MAAKLYKTKKKWTMSQVTLLAMASLSVVFLAVFAYAPMFGIVLAFKDGDGVLNLTSAVFNSDWVGLRNFKMFLSDSVFLKIMKNTIVLNLLQLLICFPAPILFALLLNEIASQKIKRFAQTISYLPHFLSWVIFAGIVLSLINLDTGAVAKLFINLKIVPPETDIAGEADYFYTLIIITSLLKGIGWGSIIYLAAISGIDVTLYEAATIDGANRFHKIRYITFPSIAPQITLFFLLSVSSLLNSGVEHILAFQNQINISASEVVDTFVLKYGLTRFFYSYATAVGLFKSGVALLLLITSNFISKKTTGNGIF